MAYIAWTEDLGTGIAAVDKQHLSIIALLNDLHLARTKDGGRGAIAKVIRDIVDRMTDNFAFEEELQAKAGYPYYRAHKRLHEQFMVNVRSYQDRFQAGEDVLQEMAELLENALIDHFRYDDGDYAPLVRQTLSAQDETPAGWLAGALDRFLAGRAAA